MMIPRNILVILATYFLSAPLTLHRIARNNPKRIELNNCVIDCELTSHISIHIKTGDMNATLNILNWSLKQYSLVCASTYFQFDGRIIGGNPGNIENFPYQLSLRNGGNHRCGASIISANWSLTASHCVEGIPLRNLTLVAGTSFRLTGGTVHQALKVIMHPNYNTTTMDYDYALISVTPAFPIGKPGVQIVKLAKSRPPIGSEGNITGWGTTTPGATALPDKLRQVSIPIVSQDICRKNNTGSYVSERMFCAGYPGGGKDSCLGDSGGPFVVKSEQVGIVSWGFGCAVAFKPGVYADVPKMLVWIKNQTLI